MVDPMNIDVCYDLCIVGAGMIGSAAARHASTNKTLKICLIGPEEPKERKVVSGQEVFGAHYDEGRITRSADIDPMWALFAQKSNDRYKELEDASGIKFYHEVGSLIVATKDGNYMKHLKRNIDSDNISPKHKFMDSGDLQKHFPYFSFSNNDSGYYEPVKAGYLNPRKQVMAQIIVASNQGCDIIRDIVIGIMQPGDEKNKLHRIITQKGRLIYAKKILLATGVFTSTNKLLPNSVKLQFKPMPQTVSIAEVSRDDAYRLRNMPVVIYHGDGTEDWYKYYPRDKEDGHLHFYFLPPIKYPDGKYYIKMGHSDSILEGPLKISEIQKWHCGIGDKVLEKHLFELLRTFCKDISFLSHHGDACVTMVMPTFHPYIDLVTPTFGVAVGGNGRAAKSSDEIGRMAAEMIIKSKWTHEIPKKFFEIKTNNTFGSKL